MNWNPRIPQRLCTAWRTRCLVALMVIGLSVAPVGVLARGGIDQVIALPGASWKIATPTGGYAITDDSRSQDGATRLMAFEHRDHRLEFFVTLKPTLSEQSLHDEREARWEQVRASAPPKSGERVLDQSDWAVLEYFVENPKSGVRTKHVHGFMRQARTSIEIHISLQSYKESKQKQLDRLLESMQVVPHSEAG